MALKFNKLTRNSIRRLQPSQTIREHGIVFERLQNGDGRYSVNIMVDGERVHRVIGKESDGVTRTQVEEFIENTKKDAREERLNLPKGRKTHLGFRKAAEQYLERLEQGAGKDIPKKRERLEHHLIPFFRDKPLVKVSTFEVSRYKKHRMVEGAKRGTVNRELAVLSHLLNKSLEWKWISQKPCKIERFKEDEGRIVYLTTEQASRLLEVARHDHSLYIYPFVLIGLSTSMRRMEILSIRVEHIDLERRVIHVPKAKTGKREQPITAQLAEFLKKHLEAIEPGQEWLFPSPGSRTGHTVAIEKPYRRVVEVAGLDSKEVVRHTLRHTAISHLVQAGVDLPTVKRISGHKTLAMVERYSHQNGEHIRSAMDALEERYLKG